MNYDEPEQPLQPIKKEIKKDYDIVLKKFIDDYFFTNSRQSKNFASALVGDNIIYAISKKGKKYYFLKTDTDNFTKYKNGNEMTFNYIEFDTNYFKKNEQNFIKSIKEKDIIGSDENKVKQGNRSDFEKYTTKNFINDGLSEILDIDPKEIPDIQPLPVQEKEDKKELIGDDDEEEEERMKDDDEEEEERMKDDEEEALKKPKSKSSFKYKEKILNANDFEKIIKEEYKKKQKDDFEDNQVFLADEYDKEKEFSDDERELFKQAKKMNDRQLNNQIVKYKQDFNLKPQRKGNKGKMPKEYSNFFKELKGRYGFNLVNEGNNTGQAYLKVGNDIIFVRKLTDKTKGTSKYRDKGDDRTKDNNLMIAIINKSDFPKLDSDNEDVKARFFNFNLDYYRKNKDKFSDAI